MCGCGVGCLATLREAARILGIRENCVYFLDEQLQPVKVPRGQKMVTRFYHRQRLRSLLASGQELVCRPYKEHKPPIEDLDRHSPAARAVWRMHLTNAATRGITNYLTIDEYVELATQACTYCGELPTPRQIGDCKELAILAGVDRVDSRKDYTHDNSVPSCWPCNFKKSLREKRK